MAEIPPGFTWVGWRNLFTGELCKTKGRPGYGWVPVYVDAVKQWIA